MVRVVLFDLDDTLFDHHHGARAALEAVQRSHACFRALPFDEMERCHARFLEALHKDVMAGRVALDDARRERFRRLFGAAGVEAGDELVAEAASMYRANYISARRAVAGALELVPLVRRRARVGIVTNNLLEEQQEKLRHLGLDSCVDALVVSEEAGVSKPDPAIFSLALDRLGSTPGDAVMVGDSWENDIAGARAAGIRAIWFNRHRERTPAGGDSVDQLHALEPADVVLPMIFDAHRH